MKDSGSFSTPRTFFLLMDMGIVKKRMIIDVGPQGGTPNFKCRDDRRIFFEFKSFDSRIFSDYLASIFWVFFVLYDLMLSGNF